MDASRRHETFASETKDLIIYGPAGLTGFVFTLVLHLRSSQGRNAGRPRCTLHIQWFYVLSDEPDPRKCILLKGAVSQHAQTLLLRDTISLSSWSERKKEICPLHQREILFLSSKVVCLPKTLEKIVLKKNLSVPFSRNMRDIEGIFSQYRLFL